MIIYSQLNRLRVDFSRRHISYDVMRTSKSWVRIRLEMSSPRSSLVPWSTTTSNPGTHLATSLAQLSSVDLGTMMR